MLLTASNFAMRGEKLGEVRVFKALGDGQGPFERGDRLAHVLSQSLPDGCVALSQTMQQHHAAALVADESL